MHCLEPGSGHLFQSKTVFPFFFPKLYFVICQLYIHTFPGGDAELDILFAKHIYFYLTLGHWMMAWYTHNNISVYRVDAIAWSYIFEYGVICGLLKEKKKLPYTPNHLISLYVSPWLDLFDVAHLFWWYIVSSYAVASLISPAAAPANRLSSHCSAICMWSRKR